MEHHEPDYLAALAEQEAGNDQGFGIDVCAVEGSRFLAAHAFAIARAGTE
jgi:hypothetical protein